MPHPALAMGSAEDPWDLLESSLQKSLCLSVCNLTIPRLPPRPYCPSPRCNCRDVLSTANLSSLPRRVASREPAAPPYTERGEMGRSLPGEVCELLGAHRAKRISGALLEPNTELCSPPWPVLVKLCPVGESPRALDRCGPRGGRSHLHGGQGSYAGCQQAGSVTQLWVEDTTGATQQSPASCSHVFLALLWPATVKSKGLGIAVPFLIPSTRPQFAPPANSL